MCETPGCNRIPNPPHRRCCTLCGPSRGQHHRRRCNRQHSMLTDAWRSFDSRSRSPMAKAMPRQLRQAVDAPSAPTSQAVDAPSAPTSQAVDAPSAPTSQAVDCALCLQRLRLSGGESIITSCGHLFCKHCWQRYRQSLERHYSCVWLRRYSLICPNCREPVVYTSPVYG